MNIVVTVVVVVAVDTMDGTVMLDVNDSVDVAEMDDMKDGVNAGDVVDEDCAFG